MCQFSISFLSDPESLIRRARQEINKAGGVFTGDAAQGNFEAKTPIGSIQGSYNIEGQEIAFAITKKPMLLSCSMIEKQLGSIIK